MIDAVFDCMVFLQAATNPRSPAFACLALAEGNRVRLHVSPPILVEVRDVLTRPKIRVKFPRLTPERVETFVQKLAALAVLATQIPSAGIALRDPDDLPYLDLAVAEQVSYLVSRDKDLLDLMNDPSFRSRRPNLHVVDPVEFLKAVASS